MLRSGHNVDRAQLERCSSFAEELSTLHLLSSTAVAATEPMEVTADISKEEKQNNAQSEKKLDAHEKSSSEVAMSREFV